MGESLKDELKEKIAGGDVVVVVGAGVSIGATGNHPTASWKGLLRHGVEHCGTFHGLDEKWCERKCEDLDGDMVDMLGVAEQVCERLKAPGGPFFARLESAFDNPHYPMMEPEVIEALAALQCPIVTTNYDDLIERVTGRHPAIWNRDANRFLRIANSQDDDILHLHGYWKAPESIVLGIRDYEDIKDDPHTQAFLRMISYAKCLLFVGCGDGLEDPHFEVLLNWLKDSKSKLPDRSFRLAQSSEVTSLQKKHDGDGIHVVAFGKKHADLAGFLESVAPPPRRKKKNPAFSGEWKAYLEHLAEENSGMPLTGLGSGIPVKLPIGEAYIPLKTSHIESFRQKGGREGFDPERIEEADLKERNLTLDDIFKNTRRRGILLLGNPGAGKTTGLRQWAWRLASGESPPEEFGLPERCLPVFLKLSGLPEPDESFADNPEAFFTAFLHSQVRFNDTFGKTVALGEAVTGSDGPLLWLVDGLDEVSNPEVRIAVFKWLKGILKTRKADRVLTAGRFQGVEGVIERGDTFARFEVEPLEPEAIRCFVEAWFAAVYARLEMPVADGAAKAGKLAGILEGKDFQDPKRAEIKANPLLLTILCIVFHEDATLPRERARVYDRCVTVMLDLWRKEVKPAVPYDGPAARSLLGRIAWWLHQKEERRAVPMDEVAAFAETQLAIYNKALPETGAEFISVIKDHAGLLAALGDGRVEFLHFTFQEFFAADHAVREILGGEMAKFFKIPWWREPTELALSQASLEFSRRFFRQLLANRAISADPAFFEKCLEMAREVDWTLFAKALRSDQTERLPLLRAVRRFRAPEVLEVCGEILDSTTAAAEEKSLAREMLDRGKATVAVAAEETPSGDFAEWTHPESGVIFVRLPAGTFLMGSPEDEPERGSNETQHEVRLSEPFWIGKYPVTNEAYERFVNATGHRAPSEWNDPRFNQPSQPVVGVSWEDAMAFCEWTGGSLPTEAQWEYACRAGTKTPFAIGDGENFSSELANFNGDYPYGKAKKGPYLQKPSPVGSYSPNAWDLYDMHGNVWEWCRDRWDENAYAGRENGITDPVTLKSASGSDDSPRVLRGGAWCGTAGDCRSACRLGNRPGGRDRYDGFRLALVPGPVADASSQPEERPEAEVWPGEAGDRSR